MSEKYYKSSIKNFLQKESHHPKLHITRSKILSMELCYTIFVFHCLTQILMMRFHDISVIVSNKHTVFPVYK